MMDGGKRLVRLLTACTLLTVGTVAGGVGGRLGAAAPPDANTTPTITTVNEPFPDDAVTRGASFKVKGSGWSPGSMVQLEVCGLQARSGSSDCAVASAQIVVASADGTVRGRLSVVVPPSPCPCVVRAFTQSSTDIATTPVEIPGAPSEHPGDGDVSAPALRRVEVHHVVLAGHDTFMTWWGAPPTRTLEFELVNTGSVPIADASITLRAGPTEHPNGFIPPVKVASLAVGERTRFRVPIEFPALSFGEQRVVGTVNGTSQPTTFAATTSTHPWLLIIVPLVVALQLLLLLIRNVVRRRLQDDELELLVLEPPLVTDDALICVIEVTDMAMPGADEAADVPEVRNRTIVLQSIHAVQELVLRSLELDEAGDPVIGQPVINSITVLADADAKVGLSYHACDLLCDWIETTFTESPHPGTRSLTLRRHVNPGGRANPAAASGMGMVPLSVMVRAPHVRDLATIG